METNEELVRASYAAFERGDLDAALSILSDDIVWTYPELPSASGLGGTKHGKAEVRASMARLTTFFREIRLQPQEYLVCGDRIAVFGLNHMRAARSGRADSVPFVHSWHFADGRATRFDGHFDTARVHAILAPRPDMNGAVDIQGLGMQFMAARVLHSAVEVGVFTELAGQALSAEDLRLRTGLHERGARDFFDALVALGLLDRYHGMYANTPAATTYLSDPESDTYLGGFLAFAGSQWYRSWETLTEAVRSGRSQVHGDGRAFETIHADPVLAESFFQAMAGGSLAASMALSEKFSWDAHRTVADIGCSDGSLIARILRDHPHLTGTGFDLPPVAAAFQKTADRFGLASRMAFTPGDFLRDPLPSADVIILGHVLLDWDLPTRRDLLAKVHEALPEGGVLVIYDMLIDDERRENVAGLLISLHMIVDFPGGSTYTAGECRRWLADAGFRTSRVEPLAGPDHLIVGVK